MGNYVKFKEDGSISGTWVGSGKPPESYEEVSDHETFKKCMANEVIKKNGVIIDVVKIPEPLINPSELTENEFRSLVLKKLGYNITE